MLLSFSELDPDEISHYGATEAGYAEVVEDMKRNTDLAIAELLLTTPSTAIMHFPKPDKGEISQPIMLAANYHGAHSEGWHRIIVQNPKDREAGQWELWTPPGAQNRAFYKRVIWEEPYPFEEEPTNPEKVSQYYAHFGPSDEARQSFQGQGFTFSDAFLNCSSNEYQRLEALANAAPYRWDVS